MKYDYVIVGAGSSGAALAGRLSEDPKLHVLLLEAGPDYPNLESLPEDLRHAFGVSVQDHDWHYEAEAVPGRMIDYARGKVTGGCSAVNGTIALRGTPADYDEWASWGNDEWSFDRCLPWFRRMENDLDASGELHGKDGPIPICRFKDEELLPIQKAFKAACLDNGLQAVWDHNDPRATGVGPLPMNRRGALRVSSAIAYLDPARARPNLTIRPHAHVERIRFEGTRAVGVEVAIDDETARVATDRAPSATAPDGTAAYIEARNVILCAGAINSPAILLRSGVGPRAHLESLGIPVVADLGGVGANLLEHQQIFVGLVPKETVTDDLPDVQQVAQYTATGSSQWNDMQIYMVNKFGTERGGALMASAPADMPRLIFGVMSVLNRSLSRGRVSLASKGPNVDPVIRIDSYTDSDGEDMRRMIEGVRFCWRIATSKPMQALSVGTAFPPAAIIDDDDALEQYVLDQSRTIWHPVGTCKMGPARDRTAVVDQYLRVHGLQNLRVVDASVMPNHVSKNPHLTCVLFAERVADWIKKGQGA